jgi:DNA-3-methyladenine glycosylase
VLVHEDEQGRASGRIVETEAYPGPEDPASHAAARIGRTRRNDPLFGAPGTTYLHLNYGVHWCLNAVTAPEGVPQGVLLLALEPLDGRERMRARRGGRKELTSGPGRLVQALGIGPGLQRHPLDRPPLWIEPGEQVPDGRVVRTTRIGISRGRELPYRFYESGNPWVSRR